LDSSTKACTRCGQDKPAHEFKKAKLWCADCQDAYFKEWRRRPDVKERQRAHRERAKLAQYGLDLDDYARMLEAQGSACAICHQQCKTGRRLAVDHDHATGITRGLLCTICNLIVGRREHGQLKREDWSRAADHYLATFGNGNPLLGEGVGLGPLPSRARRRVEKQKDPDARGKRFTTAQVAEIRRRIAGGESRRGLARELGVAHTTILRIASGQLWKDAPVPHPSEPVRVS
jgi:hypothetical protein